jgi:hypothetical protein
MAAIHHAPPRFRTTTPPAEISRTIDRKLAALLELVIFLPMRVTVQ